MTFNIWLRFFCTTFNLRSLNSGYSFFFFNTIRVCMQKYWIKMSSGKCQRIWIHDFFETFKSIGTHWMVETGRMKIKNIYRRKKNEFCFNAFPLYYHSSVETEWQKILMKGIIITRFLSNSFSFHIIFFTFYLCVRKSWKRKTN